MSQVQLNEPLYTEARRRAEEAGYSTVDEYVADVVSHDLVDEGLGETPALDHLFTPERLAHIDAAAAEIRAGNFYTAQQADTELAKRRAQWIRNNPR